MTRSSARKKAVPLAAAFRFKRVAALLVLLPTVWLTGCWDQRDIETQGFVMGVGIDVPDQPSPGRQLSLTLQLAVPSNWFGAGETKVGAAEESFWNITAEGDTVKQMLQSLALRNNRKPVFAHVQVILIGEEAARSQHLHQLLNGLLRTMEVKRRVDVLVVQGKAKEALAVQPMLEPIPAMNLSSLTQEESLTMPPGVTLGRIDDHLLNEAAFALQRLVPGKEDVKVAGLAVFDGKKQQMVGWLPEERVIGYNFLLDKVQPGYLTAVVDGEAVTLELTKSRTKLSAEVDGREISFRVAVEASVQMEENWTGGAPSDADFAQRVQTAAESEIRRQMAETVRYFQQEFGLDGVNFWRHLRAFHPDTWDWAKENWNGRFREVDVDYAAKVKVLDYGTLYRH